MFLTSEWWNLSLPSAFSTVPCRSNCSNSSWRCTLSVQGGIWILPASFSASSFRHPDSLLASLTTVVCWTDVFIELFTVIPRYFSQVITFELEPHGTWIVQIILSTSYYCPFGNVEFHPALCCPLAELCQIPWKSLSIFFCLSQPKSLCQLPVSLPDIKKWIKPPQNWYETWG